MELELDRLTKQYGPKIAVDRVSARLGAGVYGLLGANGAGKTTIMRMICGNLRPTSGEVRLDGRPTAEMGGEFRARLGYLPQDFGYYPEFTALDFMEYMAALKGLDSRAARTRSLELLDRVGLAGEERSLIRTFSGGMKQRLGIAQAVLNDPDVLVLDEPTAGLDPKERVRFRNLIASFAADKVVLLSTHIVSDVECIADSILMMRAGSLIMRGAPSEVVSRVDGMVWEARVPAREADELSTASRVVNVHHMGGRNGPRPVPLRRRPLPRARRRQGRAHARGPVPARVRRERGGGRPRAARRARRRRSPRAPRRPFRRWPTCLALSSSSSRRCLPAAWPSPRTPARSSCSSPSWRST